jgi:CBS domain containing-hemolysin-like protein
MSSFIFAILLVLLALLALTLEKTYFYIPARELKRMARGGDKVAQTLFSAEVYGGELKLILWLIVGLSAAGGIVMFARVAPSLIGFLAVVLILWLAFVWIPRTRLTIVGTYLAVWCTPAVVRLLRLLHPVSAYLAFYIGRFPAIAHTGLYEREDIYELLRRQKQQNDNRISDQDLELIRKTLRFGDYHVRDLVVPKRRVRTVSVNDNLGPVLLDELNKTNHSRFPVYDGQPSNIVGTFAIDVAVEAIKGGKVRDFFERKVAYVHENDSLEQALRALNETNQHLLVVINSFNEYVGIITLSDILQELLGEASTESFDQHEDRKAVASRHDHKDSSPDPEVAEKKVPAQPTEMVE